MNEVHISISIQFKVENYQASFVNETSKMDHEDMNILSFIDWGKIQIEAQHLLLYHCVDAIVI